MGEVPDPTTSGVDGTQLVGTAIMTTIIAPPMQSASVPDTIDGLVATHSKNLGGDVGARILAASFRQTSNQLAGAHARIAEQEVELRVANTAITELKVENAKLTAQLTTIAGTNRIKHACTFIGTAMLGLAVDLFKNNVATPAILLAVLGAALLVFVVLPHHGRIGQ